MKNRKSKNSFGSKKKESENDNLRRLSHGEIAESYCSKKINVTLCHNCNNKNMVKLKPSTVRFCIASFSSDHHRFSNLLSKNLDS